MVGPLSNCVSGSQQVFPGAYFDLDGYQKVARQWSEDHKGEYHSVNRVVGMLVAIRRSAFIKAGCYNVDLSTNGDGYGFSDDDLSRKMILAGYRLLITNDVFIHHFGGVTVGRDLSEKIKANAIKYERILHERY
jgi:GT2 family glycosyltransferase